MRKASPVKAEPSLKTGSRRRRNTSFRPQCKREGERGEEAGVEVD